MLPDVQADDWLIAFHEASLGLGCYEFAVCHHRPEPAKPAAAENFGRGIGELFLNSSIEPKVSLISVTNFSSILLVDPLTSKTKNGWRARPVVFNKSFVGVGNFKALKPRNKSSKGFSAKSGYFSKTPFNLSI